MSYKNLFQLYTDIRIYLGIHWKFQRSTHFVLVRQCPIMNMCHLLRYLEISLFVMEITEEYELSIRTADILH